MGGPPDGGGVVLHLHAGVLRVPHEPEQHGVDVQRHEIGRQGLLSRERRRDDALIHMGGRMLHNGNEKVQTGPSDAMELAQAQHDHAFPLGRNADAAGEQEAHGHGDHYERHRHRRPEQRHNDGKSNEEHRNGEQVHTVARGLGAPRRRCRGNGLASALSGLLLDFPILVAHVRSPSPRCLREQPSGHALSGTPQV